MLYTTLIWVFLFRTKFRYKTDCSLKIQPYTIKKILLQILKSNRWIAFFFTLLIHISNFVLIGYYLLYDLQAYILYIILNYKNLQFKQFIDDIAIYFYFSINFASVKDIRRICNSKVDLLKFIFNKKILSKVIVLSYN